MRIIHIITDLDTGGAEMMLFKLLEAWSRQQGVLKKEELSVISLMGHGPISDPIKALGIDLYSLDLQQGQRPGVRAIARLLRRVRALRPDVIQGWMYHGNMASTIAAFFLWGTFHRVSLFWNIRQTLYDLSNEKGLTKWLIRLGARLSWLPSKIIYNSTLSGQQHESIGYSARVRVMIPNGFDLDRFQPNGQSRVRIRKSLGLSPDALLVGHISRFHPMKDHATLLRAARRVLEQWGGGHSIYFLLVGRGVTRDQTELMKQVDQLGLDDSLLLMGERSDIPELMASLDVTVSPSAWGEGFPNVVGEAMASAIPCVVTDVGDSAEIVGDTGVVVTVGDDSAMADAIVALLKEQKRRVLLGQRARERVLTYYSIDTISEKYLNLYQRQE
ncbi:MAG: glycosyltransferase [Gammaproteobacteria bacterium]|nr:glycosyltransferase [Gammaproteobacteria bacterium]